MEEHSLVRFRQFLYRDEGLIREFLAQVEGGVFEQDTQTTRSGARKGKGGSVRAGPVRGQLERGSEESAESERVIRQTGASEFERFYSRLEGMDGFRFVDQVDEELWDRLRRGEILEIDAIIRPTGLAKVAELFATFEDVLPIAEAAGVDTGEFDEEARRIMQFVKQLTKAGPADSISVIASLASAPRFEFACTVRLEHLKTDPDTLEGEATVFGKIQRKLRRGESELVGNIFAGLENMLDASAKDELAKVFDDPRIATLGLANPKISYPAAVLTPIAIYR